MPRRLQGWLVAAAWLCVSPALRAEDGPDPAKLKAAAEEFDEGSRLFKQNKYEESAQHFESADRFAPSAAALANAIRARKGARQNARAATLAAQALARFPDDRPLRDIAQPVLRQLERSLARVDVTCQPACTLVVDGKIASTGAVASYALYLDPGAHSLVAGWSADRSRTVALDSKKGGVDALTLEAPPEVKPPPPPAVSASSSPPPPLLPAPPPSPGLAPGFFFVGAGLTVALAGVAVWSGVDTQNNPGPDKVRALCAGQPPSCPSFQQGKSKEKRTDILLGATAAFGLVAGVVGLFFTNWSGAPPRETTGLHLLPVLQVGKEPAVGFSGSF